MVSRFLLISDIQKHFPLAQIRVACNGAFAFTPPSVRAESRRVESGLMPINLAYNRELDISSRLAVEVRWFRGTGTRLWAADGLRGLKVEDGGPSSLQ